MTPEIINLYIENLLKEVEELSKTKILLDTQVKYHVKLNEELQEKIALLTNEIDNITAEKVSLSDELKRIKDQDDKQVKKLPKKDIDTF